MINYDRNIKAYCVLKYCPIRDRGNFRAIRTPSKEWEGERWGGGQTIDVRAYIKPFKNIPNYF
jgi:hypothetical protein